MAKSDVSVEFAHVDFRKRLDEGRVLRSIEIAQSVLREGAAAGETCSTCVLIDDKHVRQKLTYQDIAPFLGFLSNYMEKIDYVCFESRLVKYRTAMFRLIDPAQRTRVYQKVNQYFLRHGKLACSHDIAIWHLMRLGAIINVDANTVVPVGAIREPRQTSPPFEARRLVSVLSESDRVAEERAQEDLLNLCVYPEARSCITRLYY